MNFYESNEVKVLNIIVLIIWINEENKANL